MKSATIYNKVAKVIDDYSENVTIEVFSTKTYSDYGDLVTQLTSEYTNVPALFNRYSKDTGYEPEGIFSLGDSSVFFKGDQLGVTVGNVIVRSNGERWKIIKIDNNILNARKMVQEAGIKQE